MEESHARLFSNLVCMMWGAVFQRSWPFLVLHQHLLAAGATVDDVGSSGVDATTRAIEGGHAEVSCNFPDLCRNCIPWFFESLFVEDCVRELSALPPHVLGQL